MFIVKYDKIVFVILFCTRVVLFKQQIKFDFEYIFKKKTF